MRTPTKLSSREAAKLGIGRQSKYRAVPTVVDGIRFASKKEAKRYAELKMLHSAGHILSFNMQVRFALTVTRKDGDIVKVGEYVPDFVYIRNGEHVIEDTKGFRTPLYKWKKKHFEAQYGVEIREI